jgi:hypothetical protein
MAWTRPLRTLDRKVRSAVPRRFPLLRTWHFLSWLDDGFSSCFVSPRFFLYYFFLSLFSGT